MLRQKMILNAAQIIVFRNNGQSLWSTEDKMQCVIPYFAKDNNGVGVK